MPPRTRGVRQRMPQVAPLRTGDAVADRAQNEVTDAVKALARKPLAQAVSIVVDLEWGHNKVDHGLGVPVRQVFCGAADDMDAVVSSDQENCTVPDKQAWVYLDGAAVASVVLFCLPVT